MNIFIPIIIILSGALGGKWGVVRRVSEMRPLSSLSDHIVSNCIFLKSTEIYTWKDENFVVAVVG